MTLSSDLYPRFSPAEYQRRYQAVRNLCRELGLDALVVFGWSAVGRAAQADVHYLSGYLGMRDNYVVFPAGGEPVLLAQSRNHVPNAAVVSVIGDVRWGGPDNAASIAAVLAGYGVQRAGVVGWMPYQQHQALRALLPGVAFSDVTAEFRMLRVHKSAEEIGWLRRGAAFTDAALASLAAGMHPGMREYQLAAVIEGAYLSEGGQANFYYLASTSMEAPSACVPAQVLSRRELAAGDVVTTEISIAYGGYAGQCLRTFTVAAQPSALVAELHELALAVYEAVAAAIRPGASHEDVWAAADRIADAGYTICDGLVHGFGIGILPPNLMTRQTTESPGRAGWTFAENQTIVIQPNVVTSDQRVGVQVGELCVVTPEGAQSLHAFPRELIRCD